MLTKRNVIAIVDDNLSILGAMSRLLWQLGYDTELYVSAKEYLDAALESEAICLIIDVHLGESCGVELVRHLANTGFKIPIIFMTARDTEVVRKRVMAAGCAAFLIKPFTADQLLGALAKLSPVPPV
jgi:FixJ family two-component response regulator